MPLNESHILCFDFSSIESLTGLRRSDIIELTCLDDGSVKICSHGLKGKIAGDGAYSIAVKLSGFDVEIIERITRGQGDSMSDNATAKATVTTDFAGQDYFHFRYKNEETCQLAVFTLHNRPGIHVIKKFTH